MNVKIVVDQAGSDGAAEAILAATSRGGPSEVVTLAEFLREAGVRFDSEVGYLIWSRDRVEMDMIRGCIVCNRVMTVSNETTAELDGYRNVLTPGLVLSAYARVLADIPCVWGRLDRYPAGHTLPLNLQWRMFSDRGLDVDTPRFAYAFGAEAIDTADFDEPLWKSPFDLYTWKNRDGMVKPELHAFAVDKPKGEPVVAYFVGDAIDAFALRSGADVDGNVVARLTESITVIKDVFHCFMGETLFFVDGATVVFAAFSPHLRSSIAHGRFPAALERGLCVMV